jgi:hypothetical protein
MATVVQGAPDVRAEAWGQAIGGFFKSAAERYKQVQEMEQLTKTMEVMKQAPDRSSAMSIFSASGLAKDPQHWQLGIQIADRLHPPRDETPVEVSGYDQDTGEKVSTFVKKGDELKLSDANYRAQIFGRKNVALGEGPKREEFYSAEGKTLGMKPVGKRPEGARTFQEMTIERQTRSEERAVDSAERQDVRLDLSQKAADRATVAQNAMLKRISDMVGTKESQATETRMNRVNGLIRLDYSTFKDGAWSLSEDKKQDVSEKEELVADYMDAHPEVKSVNRIKTDVDKQYAAKHKGKQVVEPEKKKDSGGVIQRIKSAFTENKKVDQVDQEVLAKKYHVQYDPTYDYREVNGELQRKKKNAGQ